MVKIDYRSGGCPRNYIDNPKYKRPMQVPDELRKCVAFVYYEGQFGLTKLGTAFFVGVPVDVNGTEYNAVHIVTAKHLVARAKEKSSNNELILRVNTNDGHSTMIRTDISGWWFHPNDTSVDVAVMPTTDVSFPNFLDFLNLSTNMAVNEDVLRNEEIDIGDEIFLTGLFTKHAGEKNLPIVRVGNIARMPEERIPTRFFGNIDAYLIEVRSIGGLSGSPVFVSLGNTRVLKGIIPGEKRRRITRVGPTFYWLGLVHGHWELPIAEEDAVSDEDAVDVAKINTGIAIAVPVSRILEVINQPGLENLREEERAKMIEKDLPTEDAASPENISEKDFDDILKRASRQVESEREES